MISIIKKFNRIMDRRQKSRIGVLFVVTVISALLEVLGVSLIIPIITAIMDPNIIYKNGIIVEICKVLDLHSHRTFAVFCIGMLVIVFVFKSFFIICRQDLFITTDTLHQESCFIFLFQDRTNIS